MNITPQELLELLRLSNQPKDIAIRPVLDRMWAVFLDGSWITARDPDGLIPYNKPIKEFVSYE